MFRCLGFTVCCLQVEVSRLGSKVSPNIITYICMPAAFPAVVISNNTMNCKLENQPLLIAPMTTNIKRIYPHEVQYFSIFNSKEGKIQLNNIQAISRTSIIQKLGELDEVTLSKVETAIKYVLAIK